MNFSLCVALLGLVLLFDAVSSQSTSCDDAYECQNETISITSLYCNGYYSCAGGDLETTYQNVYGAYGAASATIESDYVNAWGYQSNSYATVSTKYLYSHGYLSSIYSDIEPSSGGLLVVYFSGYFAGYEADVYCYDGDDCSVYCGSSYGCYDTDFYCYSGATCYYDCSDDEDNCPTLYSGVGATVSSASLTKTKLLRTDLTDEEIELKKHANRAMKQEQMVSDGDASVTLKLWTVMEARRRAARAKGEVKAIMPMPVDMDDQSSVGAQNHEWFKKTIKASKATKSVASINVGDLLEKLKYISMGAIVTLLIVFVVMQCKKLKHLKESNGMALGNNGNEYIPILA